MIGKGRYKVVTDTAINAVEHPVWTGQYGVIDDGAGGVLYSGPLFGACRAQRPEPECACGHLILDWIASPEAPEKK